MVMASTQENHVQSHHEKSASKPTSPTKSRSSTQTPLWYRHVPKNLLLILLSIIAIPVTSTLVFASLLYTRLNPAPKPIALPPTSTPANQSSNNEEGRQEETLRRKTILVTGISMTKGITILRLLSQHTPHRIIGADTSALSPGRFSSATSAFHQLTPPDGTDAEPYIDSLLTVIHRESVDLWISCSSVVAAVEDGVVVRLAEDRAKAEGREFKAVQFREDIIERLHEKDRFVEYVQSLGLRVPESWRCTNREEVLDVLLNSDKTDGEGEVRGEGTKYLLKPIGVDDRARAAMMTLLPFPSAAETESYVNNLSITPQNPFQLQQYISGAEYCTHALIVRGRVAAFTACPSSELLMHYVALPASSQLSKAMLDFTRRVAEDGGEDFTGHLSFDFLVPPGQEDGGELVIYPIECNPRAHTAIALFADTPALASAYLSVFADSAALDAREMVSPTVPTHAYYWLGHDLVTLLILPVLDAVAGLASVDDVARSWVAFWEHAVSWRDGTFEVADPLPFAVLYHVYWPVVFCKAVWEGRKWSRVNVSTTKVFDG